MGVTCFLLLSLGLAITAQGQSCSKPDGGPNIILKDEFISSDTFEDGSKVSLKCSIGYMTEGGSPVITCTAGSWSPVRLRCQRKNCGSPGEMENGQIDFSEGTEFGDKIVITCNDGYKFVGKQGPREIFCEDQGWNDRLPTCEAVICYPPELPPGVTLSPTEQSYSFGAVVGYRCPSDLSLNGSSKASCSNDGTFDSDPPTCVKVQCADIQIPNGEKTQGFKLPYGHRDTVTFKCKDGFKMKGERTVTCGIDSQWSPALPECEEIQCADVEIPNGEKVGGSKPIYGYQETVIFKCKDGFKMRGESTVTCDMNSQWSPKLPECEKIQCSDIQIPNGEKVGVSKPIYGYQETVTFKCKDGFKMRGESTVTCDMNSQWSPKLPECESVTCKQPKNVQHGKFTPVKDSYKYKDNVEYSCDPKYKLKGSRFVTCSPDGTFAPDPPKCSSGGNILIISLVSIAAVLVVGGILVCVGYRCGFLACITKGSRRRSTDNEPKKPDEEVPLS